MHIEEAQVFAQLKGLRCKKSPGSDDIAPRLLKEGALWLSAPLACIFNRSIAESTFPSPFKIAKVSPIPKKNMPGIRDFRPISLLPVIAKIFERLVLEHVKKSLIRLYGSQQHAFRPLGSTTSALVDIVESISSRLDSRETDAVRVTCIDLTKAFDKLPHRRLLNSLNSGGIDHGFLLWLLSYLSDRYQYVVMDGISGPVYKVTSGVPQGSVLGPYLFAAYMGSLLPQESQSKIVVYADDITIIETVTDEHSSCVNDVVSCIAGAGLSVNQAKCTSLCVDRVPSHICDSVGVFDTRTHVKVLGFVLDEKLTLKEQISNTLQRASRRLYAIRILKKVLNNNDLKVVYDALIMSLIMYASPVYGQLSIGLMSKLERFHKRAHRIICDAKCKCFGTVDSRFRETATMFLLNCETHADHPLHEAVPVRMTRTKHFMLPVCRTQRRLRTFFPFACTLVNGHVS